MIFLTYNDHPSGVFSSQVIDVCRFLRDEFKIKVQLISVISSRDFEKAKEKILKEEPEALVVPAKFPLSFPGLNTWNLKKYFTKFKGEVVIARGPFAFGIAQRLKSSGIFSAVAYDGRGAVKAEFEEYIAPGKRISRVASKLEKEAVLKADFRISVSHALVKYWREELGYDLKRHVVIPTTVSTKAAWDQPGQQEIQKVRQELGWKGDEIIIAFSGGEAGWQSLDILKTFTNRFFFHNENLRLLLLTRKIELSEWAFRDRIIQKWVDPQDAGRLLSCADYGILLRKENVTNQVSSPTKFGEYLMAGLKIIISSRVGDFSEAVIKESLGITWKESIFGNGDEISFTSTTPEERIHSMEFVKRNLTKKSMAGNYKKVIENLSKKS